MEEIWKDVAGYSGFYQISNFGAVKSKKNLKANLGKHGYYVVDLYKNNKRKTCLVHRLVAEAFIPNPESKPQVNHKDGIKINNNLSNLEWVTRSENIKHAFDVLGWKNNFQNNNPMTSLGKFGKHHPASKPVVAIFNGVSIRYESATELVKKGFSSSKISECCSGKRKTHKGYMFNYATT